jgi:hypothetical protein
MYRCSPQLVDAACRETEDRRLGRHTRINDLDANDVIRCPRYGVSRVSDRPLGRRRQGDSEGWKWLVMQELLSVVSP